MPKITGINHITLATSDLNRSIAFYRDVLGFSVIATWNKGAYLTAGELWLCLAPDNNTRKAPLAEYTHIAFTIKPKHFKEMEKLIQQNKLSLWKENTSEGESIYLLDPDHHKLELHVSNLKNRIEHMKKNPYPDMQLFTLE